MFVPEIQPQNTSKTVCLRNTAPKYSENCVGFRNTAKTVGDSAPA